MMCALWISRDAEADVGVDAVGPGAEATLRRAAVVGVVGPAAATEQPGRTSRGSCRVGHAC